MRSRKASATASLILEQFERERAIALLDKGQAVIRVWLDLIHQQLAHSLKG